MLFQKSIAGMALAAASVSVLFYGCRSTATWKRDADRAAYDAIDQAQAQTLGRVDGFDVEPSSIRFRRRLIETQGLAIADPATLDAEPLPAIPHWDPAWRTTDRDPAETPMPFSEDPAEPVLGLTDILHIAAHGNRDYQFRKESLFRTALALDLEAEAFRNTFAGMVAGRIDTDRGGDNRRDSAAGESRLSAARTLSTGMRLAAALTLDLVRVLSDPRQSALGLQLDTSITFPLGRGAGRHIVAEPLTQAQRDLMYAVWDFEHYKAEFALDILGRYLGVLSGEDQVRNAAENFQRLTINARRARRLADAGRLPEIQVDQAMQEQLRAWNRWIDSQSRHAETFDRFKLLLGLPPDARIQLRREDLGDIEDDVQTRLAFLNQPSSPGFNVSGVAANAPVPLPAPDPDQAGPAEIPEPAALALALEHRLDLRVTLARIEDAQRGVIVAADGLGPELALEAQSVIGERRAAASAARGNSRLRPNAGVYGALLRLDLPLRRTAERNAFRRSLLALEQAIRDAQEREDTVKFQVRGTLRNLLQARESLRIQSEAVRIARRRVESSALFLEAGRAAIRDVLEAQEALLNAQNARTAALVDYRLGELELYKNIGRLRVDAGGVHPETTAPAAETP